MEKFEVSALFSKMLLDIGIEAAIQLLFLLAPEPPLVETIQDFASIEEGDHLFYKTPFGMNVHFYVASNLGDDKIEVYGRFCKNNDDPFVEQLIFSENRPSASSLKLEKRVLNLATLQKPDHLKRQLHEGTNIVKEKQRLEEYKTSKTLYGFLNNNSEHFVTFVKTGKAQCEVAVEFKKALMKHVCAQGLCRGGTEALKAAMKDGNWSALIVVLKKIGVLSAEGKTAITVAAENVVEAAAVQSTKSAAKSGSLQVAKKAAKVAVTKSIKGTVVVQVAFEGAVYTVCMTRAFYKYINGQMDKEEFKDYAVKRSTTTAGSLTGGIGGSLAGVAAGAAIGSVVPGIGTAIGGAVGGFVGGVSGGLGGTVLGRVTGNVINWLRHR